MKFKIPEVLTQKYFKFGETYFDISSDSIFGMLIAIYVNMAHNLWVIGVVHISGMICIHGTDVDGILTSLLDEICV